MGNSTTKKEAQANASKDFVNYLVRSGHVPASDVPTDTKLKTDDDGAQEQGNNDSQQHRSVFQVLFIINIFVLNISFTYVSTNDQLDPVVMD